MREAARQTGQALSTVQYWVAKAGDRPLDAVEWQRESSRPHGHPRATPPAIQEAILALRQTLREESALGEYGAAAIRLALGEAGYAPVPSERTINRVLAHAGVFDGQRRRRQPPPPRGWHLPAVGAGQAELDSFDVIEGLMIEGVAEEVQVLTGTALHGGGILVEPAFGWPTAAVLTALQQHWVSVGLPTYAQFDNDTRFQGPHQYADTLGRVTRLCLQLGVTPVFTPPREFGFQASVESLNGRWQEKVWHRFHHVSLEGLRATSARYVLAANRRRGGRQDSAPARRPLEASWRPDWASVPRGTVIFLRRTDAAGVAQVLGHPILVAPHWAHRLVRAEVDVPDGPIRLYALRRRDPAAQPLLAEIDYHWPDRFRHK